jgi:hypothetical protein
MGCCFPCFRTPSSEYTSIPDVSVHHTSPSALQLSTQQVAVQSQQEATNKDNHSGSPFRYVLDASLESSALKEFDPNSSVFKGCVVDQKFTNKSSFEPKFAWINPTTRSINLSEHMSTQRRHKEANIADIVTVVAGPPEKYRPPSEVSSNLDFRSCLTVNFHRGGGIDLKFNSEAERDEWCKVLTKMVRTQQDLVH